MFCFDHNVAKDAVNAWYQIISKQVRIGSETANCSNGA